MAVQHRGITPRPPVTFRVLALTLALALHPVVAATADSSDTQPAPVVSAFEKHKNYEGNFHHGHEHGHASHGHNHGHSHGHSHRHSHSHSHMHENEGEGAAFHECAHHLAPKSDPSDPKFVAPQTYSTHVLDDNLDGVGSISAEQRRSRRLNAQSPLRIQTILQLSGSHIDGRVPDLVAHGIDFWGRALRVQQLTSPLTVPPQCNLVFNTNAGERCHRVVSNPTCGDFSVPANLLSSVTYYDSCNTDGTCSGAHSTTAGSGLANTDMAMLVGAANTATCVNSPATLGYGAPCRYDQNGRPVLGYINFCPDNLNGTSDKLVNLTSLHEFAHALGFTSSTWQDDAAADATVTCYDGTTQSRKPPQASTLTRTTRRGVSNTYVMTSPSVAQVAQTHYDCSSEIGAELENQPTTSGACWASHWESRTLHGELMTTTVGDDSVVTSFTLAALADTGWYTADYTSITDHLHWGFRQGCGFTTSKCIDSSQQARYTASGHFCTDSSQTGCNAQRQKGYCSVSTWNPSVPSQFRYFTDIQKGGGFQKLDFCPYLNSYSNGDCGDPANSVSASFNYYGQSWGPGSTCIDTTLRRTGYTTANMLCAEFTCSESSVSLSLTVGATRVSATCANGQVGSQVPMSGSVFASGFVTCPPFASVCPNATASANLTSCPDSLNQCSGNGVCALSGSVWSCTCSAGYSGTDCSTSTSTTPSQSIGDGRNGGASSRCLDFFSVLVLLCFAAQLLSAA